MVLHRRETPVIKVAIAALLCMLGVFVSASVAAPLEVYGGLPSIEAASISPDGQKLAMIVTDGENRKISLRDLSGGPPKLIGTGNNKVRSLSWAGPNDLLLVVTTTSTIADVKAPRAEWAMVVDYNLTTERFQVLLKKVDNADIAILNVTTGLPQTVWIAGKPQIFLTGVAFEYDRGQSALFKVDPATGRTDLVHQGLYHTNDWLVGEDGKPLAETEYDPKARTWSLKVAQGAKFAMAHSVEADIDTPWLEGLGRDGKTALVAQAKGDLVQYREVDPKTAVWPEPFRETSGDRPIFDPHSRKLIGFYRLVGDEEVYEFLDPGDAAAWAKVVRAFKGDRVNLVSWSDDRTKYIVLVSSISLGASYAFVDLNTKHAEFVGNLYEKLGEADISGTRPFAYKAKDGLDIPGYLTLPKGRPAKGLALIVFPHGGPESRDTLDFDWWAQAMASRGYAVLQPNYRGSSGYGNAFTEAAFGEWGGKMQTDLSDGVRELARQGIVDPKRVCIAGASYGGYAALAGPTLDPGVYRCAAAVAGLSDLRKMTIWSNWNKGVVAERYWDRFMGAKDSKDPILVRTSPIAHVDKVDVPMLLVHGKDDTVVPISQSEDMVRALKAAGKPVEFVVMPSEDHWLSRGATRLLMLKTVVAFLEAHNPP